MLYQYIRDTLGKEDVFTGGSDQYDDEALMA
jgi:hypothetical protein